MASEREHGLNWLAALLSTLAAVVLAIIHVVWTPSADDRWGKLLIDTIPEAIVALLVFPVLYGLFISKGIRLSSAHDGDPKEIAHLVAQHLAQERSAGSDSGSANPYGRLAHADAPRPQPMRNIVDEVTRIEERANAIEAIATRAQPSGFPKRDVLVVVDVQNDFFENGALPVEDAASILCPLNAAISAAQDAGALIVFTQDWHPPNHKSFRGFGGAWPEHCVAGTNGAKLHPDLIEPRSLRTIKFGIDANRDGYSPFENPEMIQLINDLWVREVFVVGIATEYCVLATCIEAKKLGKAVTVVESVTRAAEPAKLDTVWSKYDFHRIRRIGTAPWDSVAEHSVS